MAQWREQGFDLGKWRNDVLRLWPDLNPLVDAIQSPAELLPATYRDVVMSRWGQGRIGVIGDAAHAMSPQLGQGANMALLDAVAVGRAVGAQAPGMTYGPASQISAVALSGSTNA